MRFSSWRAATVRKRSLRSPEAVANRRAAARARRPRSSQYADRSMLGMVPTKLRGLWMPRACPVVPHVRRYRREREKKFFRLSSVATNLTNHGASPWDSAMPRACPVVPHVRCYRREREKKFFRLSSVATNLTNHGASPWDSAMPRACPVVPHVRRYRREREKKFLLSLLL